MKNRSDSQLYALSGSAVRKYHHHALSLAIACVMALLAACSANRTGVAKGQPLRLQVGEIKELSMATRSDTTWQLSATSDNQEVVDVSRKPSSPATGDMGGEVPAGKTVFLIKGVTVGKANVVFSEKQVGADGSGRVKKTYTVTVDSK